MLFGGGNINSLTALDSVGLAAGTGEPWFFLFVFFFKSWCTSAEDKHFFRVLPHGPKTSFQRGWRDIQSRARHKQQTELPAWGSAASRALEAPVQKMHLVSPQTWADEGHLPRERKEKSQRTQQPCFPESTASPHPCSRLRGGNPNAWGAESRDALRPPDGGKSVPSFHRWAWLPELVQQPFRTNGFVIPLQHSREEIIILLILGCL